MLPAAFHSWRSQTCLESNSSPLNHRGAFVRLRYLELSVLGILNTWNSLCGVKMFTFRTEKKKTKTRKLLIFPKRLREWGAEIAVQK